jgi:ADP-heptose:LPS heptosyltransferase
MIPPDGRLSLDLGPPRDRMIADRARRCVGVLGLSTRAIGLHVLWLFRRRERRPPHPSRVSRILAVRAGGLGGMALTSAALQDLADHFRKAELTVLAPAAPLSLLEAHPAVARRTVLAGTEWPPDLPQDFDLAIDFTADEALSTARLVAQSRSRFRIGFSGAGRQVFFSLAGPRLDRHRHILDLNRDLVAALGSEAQPPRPVLHVTADEKETARRHLARLGVASPRIMVHPGGARPSGRWPAENFAEVISSLTGSTGAACLVLGGPGEERVVERVCAATPDALPLRAPSVREMMALIAACDLFLGNLSGPLQVAGALGIATVAVIGPDDPGRLAPRDPADRFVRKDLPCAPCDRRICWHHTCLRAVGPEEVLQQAEGALRPFLAREVAR